METPYHRHDREVHYTGRMGWLRAAVLGANDGIVSIAGLVVGVASSHAAPSTILATGVAGTVAAAMSMAAGEYVSVQTQADTEQADLRKEAHELHHNPEAELQELAGIYRQRGLSPELALQVAHELTAHNALAAHARDELGISHRLRPRPVQAALASAAAFCSGALLPIGAALFSPAHCVEPVTMVVTLIGLSITGALAAYAGGASPLRGAVRVVFWGALAMGAASLIGRLFDVRVTG